MKKAFLFVGMFLLWISASSLAGAQSNNASSTERDLVRRELEAQLARDRGNDVFVRIETAESIRSGNFENNVRGTATITSRRGGSREDIWFDFVVDARRNRISRSDWGYGRDSGNSGNRDRDGWRPGGGGGSSRNTRYEIELVATRRLLDIGNGGEVVQSSSRNSRSQQWELVDAGNGYQYIRSADTGEVMTYSNDGRNGATITLSRMQRGRDDQLWEVRPGPDNGYYFITRRGKAMDSPSSARFDGGRMQIYDRNGEANQRFLLREVRGGRYDDRYPDRNPDRYPDRNPDRFPNQNRPDLGAGRLIWSGRVDDVIELEVRGRNVRERLISGQQYNNGRFQFDSSLPNSEVNVRVEKRRGRGRVDVIEQPSRRNGYTAVIQIRDSSGGADDYEIEVTWN